MRLGGEGPNIEIPEMRLKELHYRMRIHFDKWTEMFINKLDAVQNKLPITTPEIKITCPGKQI